MLLQIAGVSSFIRLNNIPLFYIAQSVNHPPSTRPGFDTWVRKIHWRRKWQPIPVFLAGESHGQRSLEGYSPWGRKSRTWLATKPPCVCVCVCVCVCILIWYFLSIHLSMDIFSHTLIIVNNTIVNIGVLKNSCSTVIESTCQCRRHKRCGFTPWIRKISCSRKWQPAPVFLPEKFQGTEEPGGLQSTGSQSRTRLSKQHSSKHGRTDIFSK